MGAGGGAPGPPSALDACNDDQTLGGRVVRSAGERREEFVLSHRLYSASELSALLDAAGFPETAIFGSLAGAPYNAAAESLVVVAGV